MNCLILDVTESLDIIIVSSSLFLLVGIEMCSSFASDTLQTKFVYNSSTSFLRSVHEEADYTMMLSRACRNECVKLWHM